MADHDADGWQHLGEEAQHAVRILGLPQGRSAAPAPVRCQRPDAYEGEQHHHLLEERIDGAEGEKNGGDWIAEAGRRQVCRRSRSERRRGIGGKQNEGGEPCRDDRAEDGGGQA